MGNRSLCSKLGWPRRRKLRLCVCHSCVSVDVNVVADTEEQLRYLEQNPQKYLEYRKQIENELNQRFKFIIKGSPGTNCGPRE